MAADRGALQTTEPPGELSFAIADNSGGRQPQEEIFVLNLQVGTNKLELVILWPKPNANLA
jgi:hypothetical protein